MVPRLSRFYLEIAGSLQLAYSRWAACGRTEQVDHGPDEDQLPLVLNHRSVGPP
jgi:hypothetical protein